jgi:hypothetical protein
MTTHWAIRLSTMNVLGQSSPMIEILTDVMAASRERIFLSSVPGVHVHICSSLLGGRYICHLRSKFTSGSASSHIPSFTYFILQDNLRVWKLDKCIPKRAKKSKSPTVVVASFPSAGSASAQLSSLTSRNTDEEKRVGMESFTSSVGSSNKF